MYKYLDSKLFKTVALLLALVVAVVILFFPETAFSLFGNDLSMWRGYTGIAVIGLSWIFLGPILGATLENSVNEATLVSSIGVFVITITNWHGLGSLIPTIAAVAFAFQTGKHRFFR